MAFIKLNNEKMPGISGLLQTYQETAEPLCLLAEKLLRKDSPFFSKMERELLASYVSYLNQCVFCSSSHGAVADYYANEEIAFKTWGQPNGEHLSDKMKALLRLGKDVQSNFKKIQQTDVDKLQTYGLTDDDINEAVLIAAAFCLYNRYVEALGTNAPAQGDPAYKEMGQMLAQQGYLRKRV